MSKILFGKSKNGEDTYKYTIQNGEIKAVISDYGATLINLFVNGIDVVLGYDTLKEYEENSGYLGATVGRVANRIENARFTLDNKIYNLSVNDGKNHLHGGVNGLSKRVFAVKSKSINSITFECNSVDGEDGYPGNLNVFVTYTLTNSSLIINYSAISDEKTPVSLTNHAYFNLNGQNSGDILAHTLTINAKEITPTDSKLICNGTKMLVSGTAYDFTSPKKIGEKIYDKTLQSVGGYDINYCLNGQDFRLAASVCGDKSKIIMDVFTDQTGIQLYTSNFLNTFGKNGAKYFKHSAFCLETQSYPNAVNYPLEYGFKFLEKGETYKTKTEYRFR